ncbi:MAG: glycosyltransferase [Verrucomicrobiales bacterium]|nr:glycosyltransferase [Verrucomicrobiales bacterium]
MPEELPSVSIIIPCYNYAHFLPDAIESALNQTYSRCEVIVVDDGSTDNTSKIAESYGDPVRYIYQKNAGLSAARNTGIRKSVGEFLVFLDADDKLKPQMVNESYQAMGRLGCDYGVVANLGMWMNEAGEVLDKASVFSTEDSEITVLDLLIRNRFGVTALVRKKIFDQCGLFDEQLRASEDRDMWVRASASGFRIMRLGSSLFVVRRHGSNMSREGGNQTRSVARVLEKAYGEGTLSGIENIFWLKIEAYYLYQKSVMQAGKKPLRSCFAMLRSIALWPVFTDLERLGERPWFRLKMFGWILSQTIRRKW